MPISRRIGDLVTRRIVSVDEEQTVYEAVALMVAADIGGLVVTSLGRPTGIVTERDLIKKVTLLHADPRDVKVRSIMSTPLITIDSEASLGDAASLMQEKRIRRLAVRKGTETTGLVTQRDLERELLDYFRPFPA